MALDLDDEDQKLLEADEISLVDSEIFECEDSDSDQVPFLSLRGISSQVSRVPKILHKLPPLPNLFLTLKSVLLALLPSFISTLIIRPESSVTRQGQGIAALDGLRGLGALTVFNLHYTYVYSASVTFGYGEGLYHTSIINFPFIRLFWSGKQSVAIFFVISGYVLCYKPLKAARSRSSSEFHQALSSSVFRRALRLYIAPFTATFLSAMAVRVGIFDRGSALWGKSPRIRNSCEIPPEDLGSCPTQLFDALKYCLNMLDQAVPWSKPKITSVTYDIHFWTIPTEFRNSMVVFIVLLGTSRLRTPARLTCHLLLLIYTFWSQRLNTLQFLAGMTLAEIDMIRKESNIKWSLKAADDALPLSRRLHARIWRTVRKSLFSQNTFWLLIFVIGLFLLSSTYRHVELVYGYRTLSTIFPDHWFKGMNLINFGAILTTWAVANSDLLEPLFTNPFCHYLGKISFSLYVMHGSVIKSLLYAIVDWTYDVAASGTTMNELSNFEFAKAWALGYVCILPVTVWVADLFCRAVDMPAVRFARWVEGKLLVKI